MMDKIYWDSFFFGYSVRPKATNKPNKSNSSRLIQLPKLEDRDTQIKDRAKLEEND
ncbi:MAG: hypothetical protein ACI9LM_001117 [Alteromonadaceae bacterium]|jgi:hypothetical protein